MKGMAQDMVVGLCGLFTSVLVALLLYWLDTTLDFGIYNFSLLFVIPVGAIGAGFVASSGYLLGAKAFGMRPTPRLLLSMVLISVGCYFLIHYLSYVTIEVQSQNGAHALREIMSFGDYLDLMIRNMTIGRPGHDPDPKSALGAFGYVFAVLQALGFCVGGLFLYFVLRNTAYCEDCQRYLVKQDRLDRYFAEQQDFQDAAGSFDGKQAAVWHEGLLGLGKPKAKKGQNFGIRLRRHCCKTCDYRFARLSLLVRNGAEWKEEVLAQDGWKQGSRAAGDGREAALTGGESQ